MSIPGIGSMGRAVRQLKRRFGRKAIILLYHRIAEVDSDSWNLCVSQNHFAEHLEVLRQHFCPMRLQELVQGLQNGNLAHRAVAVTFDDGYADNLYNAKPLLEQYGVPATIFVATGYVGINREFWWDELGRVLLAPGRLPEKFCLRINGRSHRWDLGAAADYEKNEQWLDRRRRAWEGKPGSRLALYHSLWGFLRPLSDVDREKLLGEILAWAGAESICRPTHHILTREEVVALARGGLIEVGAHTVSHPLLSAFPPVLQRAEIQRSKAELEELLDRRVTSFAYPYGGRSDYTAATVTLVREAGFRCACSNFTGMVGRRTDPFQLPRIHVQDWDGEEFARQLSSWCGG